MNNDNNGNHKGSPPQQRVSVNKYITYVIYIIFRYKSLFNPGLPQEKIKAIKNTSIGVMDKIIFKFDKPWWPKQGTFFGFLQKTEDNQKVPKEDYWITRIFAASNPMGSRNALTMWTSGEVAKMVRFDCGNLPTNII